MRKVNSSRLTKKITVIFYIEKYKNNSYDMRHNNLNLPKIVRKYF